MAVLSTYVKKPQRSSRICALPTLRRGVQALRFHNQLSEKQQLFLRYLVRVDSDSPDSEDVTKPPEHLRAF